MRVTGYSTTAPEHHGTRRRNAFPRGRSLSLEHYIRGRTNLQQTIYLARAISRGERDRERVGKGEKDRRDATQHTQPTCAADCGRLSVETRPRYALATGALLAANGDLGDDAPLTGLRAPIRIGNWSKAGFPHAVIIGARTMPVVWHRY